MRNGRCEHESSGPVTRVHTVRFAPGPAASRPAPDVEGRQQSARSAKSADNHREIPRKLDSRAGRPSIRCRASVLGDFVANVFTIFSGGVYRGSPCSVVLHALTHGEVGRIGHVDPGNQTDCEVKDAREREDPDAPGVVRCRSHRRFRAGGDCRHGEGSVRRRAARRRRGSRQPGADRESPHRRHRRHRAVPDRRPAARDLHRHLHPAGLQHIQAGRHRAERLVHRDHQRRPQGRRARRNDHRDRRNAGRGRAERETRGDADQRRHQVDPVRPQLQRHRRGRARRRHQPERHRDGNGHDPVSHPRRPQQRRAHDDRRAQHRESGRRQSATRLRRRHRQRPGSHLHDVRRSRRVGDRRAGR